MRYLFLPIIYLVKECVFNMTTKLSIGYYLSLKNLSIGAYYKYSLYNENFHLYMDKSSFDFFWKNEYDLSLYYNIAKGLCLKFGTKNGAVVSGIYRNGLELGYDINNSTFIIKSILY